MLVTAVALAASLLPAGTAWGASGGFERAWGKDVVTGGGTPFEICIQAASCKSGVNGAFDLGGEFANPYDVAVDSAGNSYVADTGNNRIQKFGPGGGFLRAWGKDVVAGNNVTGYEICTVAQTCQAGSEGGQGGEFKNPSGVSLDSNGNVYVADDINHRIQKFDPSGDFLLTWGKNVNVFGGSGFETCDAEVLCIAGAKGSLGGEFQFPWNVAVGVDGSVYVTDLDNRRVQKFNSSGGFVLAWGKDVAADGGTGFEKCTVAASCKQGQAGGLGGELNAPAGIAVDHAGDVYVDDANNQRIDVLDSSGNFLRAWGMDVVTGGSTGFEICTNAASCRGGSGGQLGGELNSPYDVSVDGAGDVYVSDTRSDRIQEFDASGTFLRAWGKDVVAGGGTDFEICTIAASCQVGSSGGFGGELAGAVGLGTDSAGTLYVADTSNQRIQVFGEAVDPPPPPSTPLATGTTDNSSQTGTLGTTETPNPQCQLLRKKLKKAKTKAAKRKFRRKLRALGC
jgi:tripartite motif-containing protein 71